MIRYDSFRLKNGLQVYVIPDRKVKTAVLNLAYNVGARDEDPSMTGFAHLFEHLMFGGSINIPEFDTPLQLVGGESNAYTTADYTNYYMTLPSTNLETAFWLESDRMLSLSFDQKVLGTQQKVVVEEFKQRYLNRPYGDVWHHLRPVAYSVHPYRWPVIGADIQHVENASLEDVRNFFFRHYNPDNAVLVVGGDVDVQQVADLSEKWFGTIQRTTEYNRNLPQEPTQSTKRELTVEAEVPQNALYKVFHIPGRTQRGYHAVDLLSDVLGRGKSSRLHEQLVKKEALFTSINASVTGSADPGLLVIQGFLKEGVDSEVANKRISEVIDSLKQEMINGSEYDKIIHQAISSLAFSRLEVMEKCVAIAYGHLLGDADYANRESDNIKQVTREGVMESARTFLNEENSTTLYYLKKN